MMLGHGEMLVRIAAGGVLGGVIGYERDYHGRPAGLRTHFLVSLAAATFMIVSSQFAHYQHFEHGELVEVDASRIAASVVSAIGFLAGGSILRSGATVQGLTTAAGLWLVTAIGLCAGAGMFVESIAVTAMGLVALTVLRRFEDKNDAMTRRRIAIVLGDEATVPLVMRSLADLSAETVDVDVERRLDDKRRTTLRLDIKVPVKVTPDQLLAAIEQHPGVRRIHIGQVT